MSDIRTELIRRIHQSPTELVLAVTGGGSLAIGDLLSVPGGSKTLLEAIVPYTPAAIDQYMGRTPEHYCCERSARLLAMAAFQRGRELIKDRIQRSDANSGKNTAPNSGDASGPSSNALPDPAASGAKPLAAFYEKHGLEGTVDATADGSHDGNADLIDLISLIGVGCTASLSTDREKKGGYRVCIATQTLRRTTVCSLELIKGKRTRAQEERLVADLVLNMIENARSVPELQPPDPAGDGTPTPILAFSRETEDNLLVEETLPLGLEEGERLNVHRVVAMPPLVDLFFGHTAMILWKENRIECMRSEKECEDQTDLRTAVLPYNPYAEYCNAMFAGAFNPIHQAHRKMISLAGNWLSCVVALEVSVLNARKPPMDYMDLYERLEKIEAAVPGQPVWLTKAPLFRDKAILFPGTTFVVGADTLRSFADPRHYDDRPHVLHDILREIAALDCRFLVFARKSEDGVESLETLRIPDMLRSLCDEIPPEDFCVQLSSTELRRREKWSL